MLINCAAGQLIADMHHIAKKLQMQAAVIDLKNGKIYPVQVDDYYDLAQEVTWGGGEVYAFSLSRHSELYRKVCYWTGKVVSEQEILYS